MKGIQASVRVGLGRFRLEAEFDVPASGVTALFGRSGSGKTSILRWIAGLVKAEHGRLCVNGEIWEDTERGIHLPSHRRAIGYVFQESGLFPHLSVRENLLFGVKRTPGGVVKAELGRAIDMMEIGGLLDRSPLYLSGGERQRVAIARSLLIRPQLLLLDEPLSALDEESKAAIFSCLEKMKAETKTPIFYVSHSTAEVERFADRIIRVEEGRTRPPSTHQRPGVV